MLKKRVSMCEASRDCRRQYMENKQKGRTFKIDIFSLNMASSGRHKKSLTTEEVHVTKILKF